MSDPIMWINEQRRLGDLIPWAENPKQLTKEQAANLKASLKKFNQALPFLISPDNDIYDGHQRDTLMLAMSEFGPDSLVDVRVSSRPLSLSAYATR